MPARCEVEDFISCGLEALIALDRPLRPGEGRHARAVRVDPHPRRRARRAAPPGLGAALACAAGSATSTRPREQFTGAPRPPPDRARSSPTRSAIPVDELRRREDEIAVSDVTSLNTLVLSDDETTIERIDTLAGDDRRADPRARRRPRARPRTVPRAPSTASRSASARSPSCSTSRTSRCARSARSSASPRAASARSTRR